MPFESVNADLLDRRAALLAEVVAADRDRVPPRDPLPAVREQVGGQPDRALRRVDEVAARDVLLEDVVLGRAAKLLGGHALLLADQLVEQQEHRRGRVDRHRRRHLVERDLVERRPHVVDRVDRDAGAAHLAQAPRVIGVEPELGREVERHRQTRSIRGRAGSGSARSTPSRSRSRRTGASSTAGPGTCRDGCRARTGTRPARQVARADPSGRSWSVYRDLISIPESVNRLGSSGPTIGAIVRCSSVVAMPARLPASAGRLRRSLHRSPVRLFAALRERAGASELELELPDGALVGDALERMRALTEGVPVVMAVNHEYADAGAPLHGGDEVALIPPISGGAVGALHARLTTEPLALDPLVERVRDPRAGAVVTFLGVTREVAELEYEAYAEMAERQIDRDRGARDRAPRAVRGGGRASRRYRAAVRGIGGDRGVGASPRRGVRGRARDHRRDQGAGADLEEGRGRMGPRGDAGSTALRSLPAVHELAGGARRAARARGGGGPARDRRSSERRSVAGAPANGDLLPRARELLAELEHASLRRVLNATGVILHTNLGRAPLPARRPRGGGARRRGVLEPRARPGQRRAGVEARPRRAAAVRSHGRRGGDRRQQRRRRGAAGRGGARGPRARRSSSPEGSSSRSAAASGSPR